MLGKYLDKYVHIKENARIDALKNEAKVKCRVRKKRKRNPLLEYCKSKCHYFVLNSV